MKIKIYSLIVETTRKCNMSCAHCLRGNVQNKNIKKEVIDKILDTFEISSVVFTGGEPSLNIEAIDYFRKGLEKRNLSIDNFYVVTNGKSNQKELALATLNLFPFCIDYDMCGLALSQDKYHEKIDQSKASIFYGLSYFKPDDKACPDSYKGWIKTGRAKENGIGYDYCFLIPESFEDIVIIEDKETVVLDQLYITVDGLLYGYCDSDYETIDRNNFGTIDDLVKYSEKACMESEDNYGEKHYLDL